KQNIPLVSPNEITLPMINLIIILTTSNDNNIIINARDGIKYTSLSSTLNLVVLIKNIEKKTPTIITSIISSNVKRNAGIINIHIPLLINKGGSRILFTVSGLLAAFILTNIISIAIPNATIVLATIKNVWFTSIHPS